MVTSLSVEVGHFLVGLEEEVEVVKHQLYKLNGSYGLHDSILLFPLYSCDSISCICSASTF